ncbi:hypothetical protein CEXT_747181 [Caerostris extrusa]|uniref:Uncharacterized protein n=1 Tax=Caerostris extrusa TaxID=172846 RepID=A0AAV4M5T3_CAEEX|nr:hypothetical protein CEXT_747181 [Caerostris extrusa]
MILPWLSTIFAKQRAALLISLICVDATGISLNPLDAVPEFLTGYVTFYPNIIQTAVSSFPLVEELIIDVYHKDCLEPLQYLQKLSVLIINFEYCLDGLSTFTTLISKIGHQIKRLLISGLHVISLNLIFNLCPRLEYLNLSGSATVSKPIKTCMNLQLLTIQEIDKNLCISSCQIV